MRVKRLQTTLLLIFISGLLLFGTTAQVAAQEDEVNVPQFQIEKQTIETNDKNDLYVESSPFHQLIDETFYFSESSMDHNNFGDDASYIGVDPSRDADEEFNDDGSGIMQFLNTTNVENELNYERSYYSLTDEDGNVENLFLTDSQSYVFSVEVEEITPMFFEILISQISGTGGANSLALTINSLSPSGETASAVWTITRNIRDFIPFFPQETGTYQFSISPDENAILDSFDLDDSPDVDDAERSYSEHLEEDDSVAKYLMIDSEDIGTALWNFNGIVYQSQYLSEQNFVTFGNINFFVFDPAVSNIHGTTATGSYIVSSGAVYVAIIATPSSSDNPDIRRAMEKEDTPDGMDIEYTLTFEPFELDELRMNRVIDTQAEESYSVQTDDKVFRFEASSDMLMGVNATTNLDAFFHPLERGLDTVQLDPATNDILNVVTDDAVLIPEGSYYVVLPTGEEYQFTPVDADPFDVGTSINPTQTFEEDRWFFIAPNGEYTMDFFNFTYTEEQNRTATYNLAFYDSDGSYIANADRTVAHFYDNNTDSYVIANDSSTIPTYNFGLINIEGFYLKLTVTSNDQYNVTGYVAQSDNTTISTTIGIERLNSLKVADEGSDALNYRFAELTTGDDLTRDITVFNSTNSEYLSFETNANTVYRLTIDVTNRTVSSSVIDAWFSTFVSGSQSVAQNISGLDHYILELEFATTEAIDLRIYISYDDAVVNGTSVISIETLGLVELDAPNFPAISPLGFLSTVGEVLSNPWVWVGVGSVAVVGIVAVLVRRGTISLPFRN